MKMPRKASNAKLDRREGRGVSVPASKDQSVNFTSFVKVMIHDKFSEVLILPPKYAKTVSDLIDQKIQLEDANGLTWTVTLSKYNSYFAFQKGWQAFSVEHDIKFGEFLVFSYIKHAHFRVTIFGTCACEKRSPPKLKENNNRKRKGTHEISSCRDKHMRKTDCDNVNEQNSNNSVVSVTNIVEGSQSMPIRINDTSKDNNNIKVHSDKICIEEPFYMVNRDIRAGQGELRDTLYDLASFEKRPCDVSGTGKTILENGKSHEQNMKIPSFKSEVREVEEIPVPKGLKSSPAVPVVLKFESTKKSKDVLAKEKSTPVTKTNSETKIAYGPKQCSNRGSGKEQLLASQKQQTPFWVDQSQLKKCAGGLHSSGVPVSVKPEPYSSGKEQFSLGKGQFSLGKDQFSLGKQQFSATQKQQAPFGGSDQSSDKKFAGGSDLSGFPVPNKPILYSQRTWIEMKQEQAEVNQEAYVHGGPIGGQWIMKLDPTTPPVAKVNNCVPNVVKPEPLDTIDDVVKVAVKIPVSEAPPKTYLELPDRLVPVPRSAKQRSERKLVVHLKGPVSSMWPVLYNEKYGFKVFLTSGWEAFRKANNIMPGDECVFGLINATELIFKVSVLHK